MDRLTLPFELPRRVQLWSYAVAHSVLLLRANRKSADEPRVDLMFRAVREMRVGHRFTDLSVSILEPGDAKKRFDLSDDVIEDRTVFGLATSGSLEFYVVAGSLHVAEDDLDYGDPSSLDDETLSPHVSRSGRFPS